MFLRPMHNGAFFKATDFNQSHDQFLIITNQEVYRIGASLKNLGKNRLHVLK
jgi:hypothetical protein